MFYAFAAVFIIFFSLMPIAVFKLINHLQLQRDNDDQSTVNKSDGIPKYMIGLFLFVGFALIFVNWYIIWFGHIRHAY